MAAAEPGPAGPSCHFAAPPPSLRLRGATWRRGGRCCWRQRCCWRRRPPSGPSRRPSVLRRAVAAAAAARCLPAASTSPTPAAPPWGRAAPCWRRPSSGTGRCSSPPPARPVRRGGGCRRGGVGEGGARRSPRVGRRGPLEGQLALSRVALFLQKNQPTNPNPRVLWGDLLFFNPLIPSVRQGLVARGDGGCGLVAPGLELPLVAKGGVALVRGG